MMRLAVIILLAVSGSGCGTVNDYLRGKDNSEPPAALTTFTNSVTVQTVWSTRVGSGSDSEYFKLSPSVANGKVFAADRRGRVSAYAANNGRSLWSVETKTPISGGPGSGDHDDPDKDGLDNALEFALGGHPLNAGGPVILPTVTRQPGPGGTVDFQFTYTRPLNVPGATFTVQRSANMTAWTTVPDNQISATAVAETRRAVVTLTAGERRLYLRLNVTIAP